MRAAWPWPCGRARAARSGSGTGTPCSTGPPLSGRRGGCGCPRTRPGRGRGASAPAGPRQGHALLAATITLRPPAGGRGRNWRRGRGRHHHGPCVRRCVGEQRRGQVQAQGLGDQCDRRALRRPSRNTPGWPGGAALACSPRPARCPLRRGPRWRGRAYAHRGGSSSGSTGRRTARRRMRRAAATSVGPDPAVSRVSVDAGQLQGYPARRRPREDHLRIRQSSAPAFLLHTQQQERRILMIMKTSQLIRCFIYVMMKMAAPAGKYTGTSANRACADEARGRKCRGRRCRGPPPRPWSWGGGRWRPLGRRAGFPCRSRFPSRCPSLASWIVNSIGPRPR